MRQIGLRCDCVQLNARTYMGTDVRADGAGFCSTKRRRMGGQGWYEALGRSNDGVTWMGLLVMFRQTCYSSPDKRLLVSRQICLQTNLFSSRAKPLPGPSYSSGAPTGGWIISKVTEDAGDDEELHPACNFKIT